MCLRLPLESTSTIRHPRSPSLRTVLLYLPAGMALILFWFPLHGSLSQQACLNCDSHIALVSTRNSWLSIHQIEESGFVPSLESLLFIYSSGLSTLEMQ